ncbi:cytochrome c1 [Pseudazoarcus pumilus]|uniref:Cytochrome c1 n=1 Tax=Pseudazoarcus pumilus TaxID=2067960 RepID=A0A2I6S4E0_9RHOO|nr:cytochrome c1 [Pseudazoarcus pumilus]AUN94122.1 cytochrome c1 [Pseudazoarcus pumilus]
MRLRMFKTLKRLMLAVIVAPALAVAAPASVDLDRAPVSMDPATLQHGAKLFVNYCLNCHSASFVRYNKLTEIGLTEDQIRDNLMFAGERVGDLMTIAMRPKESKEWFGATPPDLSLVARQRNSGDGSGADWLYTYLRQFYRDPNRPTGWNNLVFENVGMPHVLWELQGEQVLTDGKLVLDKPGRMDAAEYDRAVADLVSFMVWMGEPGAEKRETIGVFVLIFLVVFTGIAYALKKNYWKDIH